MESGVKKAKLSPTVELSFIVVGFVCLIVGLPFASSSPQAFVIGIWGVLVGAVAFVTTAATRSLSSAVVMTILAVSALAFIAGFIYVANNRDGILTAYIPIIAAGILLSSGTQMISRRHSTSR